MKTIPASQLAEILGAQVVAGNPGALVSAGVSTDTRTISPGSAFFALRGERFDGHEFVATALDAVAR